MVKTLPKNTNYIKIALKKLFIIKFPTKNSVDAYFYPPTSIVELGGFKDCHFWIIIMQRNGKIDSFQSSMLPKIPIILKIASNKNCSKLNFLKKPQWMHIFISPRSGARGLQTLPCLKYYNVLQWESKFTLWLNGAKNTDYIKNCFK